jgi:Fic family protein
MDPLTKAGLAHVQFETLHPFLDGNGRVGRLLISLLLCTEGVLKEPMLYLSLFLKQHRSRYYELLQRVRIDGDWEAWLDFFYQGVAETAEGAVATVRQLLAVFSEDRKALQAGKLAGSVLQVHHYLQARPIASSSAICKAEGLSPATVNKALGHLVGVGMVREITGGQRNRLFAYDRALKILAEGTESPFGVVH